MRALRARRTGKPARPNFRTIALALATLGSVAATLVVSPVPAAAAQHPRKGSTAKTAPPSASKPGTHRRFDAFENMAIVFEPNAGQADPRFPFVAHGAGFEDLLSPTEADVVLDSPDAPTATKWQRSPAFAKPAARSTLRMALVGAQSSALSAGTSSPTRVNYLVGNDPTKWIKGLPTFRNVTEKAVYPGISVTYYGTARHLEWDYTVAPGADPAVIALSISGAGAATQQPDGSLSLQVGAGTVTLSLPLAFQQTTSGRHSVGAKLVKSGSQYAVRLGAYDHSKPVTIDPLLNYSDYVGGSASDQGMGVAVDGAGRAYVAGYTSSPDFPVGNAYSSSWAGGWDGFVSQVAPDGQSLNWSTYLGGSGDDRILNAPVLDAAGDVWVAGSTSSANFPTTTGEYQTGLGAASQSAFVAELSGDGTSLLAGTYLHGSATGSTTSATDIVLDSSGAPYVTGTTTDTTFPTTSGVVQPTTTNTANSGLVTKLTADLKGLTYSTFLTGTGETDLNAIVVDASGDPIVGGQTYDTDYPTTAGVIHATNPTPNPSQTPTGVVTKLNASATSYLLSTYTTTDSGDVLALAINASGQIYVGGGWSSADVTTSFPQDGSLGNIGLLAADASAWVWNDGVGMQQANSIAVDSNGRVAVAGYTISGTDPSSFAPVDAWQGAAGDQMDAQVVLLDPAGAQELYATYLGGTQADEAYGVAVDGNDTLYATGLTDSWDFPTTTPQSSDGNGDAFVARLLTSPVGGPVTPAFTFGSDGNTCASCAAKNSMKVGKKADPVDAADGNFTEGFTDFSIPGRGLGLSLSRTYNSLAAATTGAFGYGWSSNGLATLTVSGNTATVTQENGSQAVFTQSGGTWAPSAPRYVGTLTHNVDGSWTMKRLAQETLTFNSSGQLTSQSDLNGYATTYAWSGTQLTSITDPSGRNLTFVYTGSVITQVHDGAGRTVTYGYNDGSGNLTDVTDVNGGHWQYGYDTSHRMTMVKDPQCYATSGCPGVTNDYDANGRVDWQKDQLGRQTSFAYSASGADNVTVITDPVGNKVQDVYQEGLLIEETAGYGTWQAAVTLYGYDQATLAPVSIVDGQGHGRRLGYDSNGNVDFTVDALGNQTSATFNSFNEPLSQTDGNYNQTTYTYDGNGNRTSTSAPLNDGSGTAQTTTYHYDDTSHPGDVTSVTDPDNKVTTYGYDNYGNRVSVTDPMGDKSTTAYNTLGWITSAVSPKGNVAGCNCATSYTTTYSYIVPGTGATDQYGDVQTVTDPLGHTTTYGYDGDRRRASVTDSDGNVTTYVYDLAGEQTQVKRADSPQTTLITDYNGDGTVQDEKDGKGNPVISYTYDQRRDLITTSDALGNTTTYTYDAAGNRVSRAAPGGSCTTSPTAGCTTYAYDPGNELQTVTYDDGVTPNITSLSYDGDGQRISMTDGTGTWRWYLDTLHRVTSVVEAQGGGASATVSYGYNLRNEVTSVAYPGGTCGGSAPTLCVTRGYDEAGRWTSVQDWNGQATSFGYDANSNLTTVTLPASTGVVDTYGFNDADQLTSISDVTSGTPFFSASYARDANGQLTSDSSAAANQGAFKYTPLNQLCYAASSSASACASPPSGSQPFSYDAADNLVQMGSTTQQFNAADELCWTYSGSSSNNCLTPPAGADTFGYSASGDRTSQVPASGSATCYAYDEENRLTSVVTGTGSSCTTPSTVGTYSYNGDGLRMSKTAGGTTTLATWDVAGGLPLQIGDGSTWYVYGPGGLPLEQIAGSTTLWFHHDQIGSTRALTDSSGTVQSTWQFDPYGNQLQHTGAATTPFLYTGQYRDAESGLFYLRARYYDAETAQFLTPDLRRAATRAPYAYAGEDPMNMSDALGLAPCPHSLDDNQCEPPSGATKGDACLADVFGEATVLATEQGPGVESSSGYMVGLGPSVAEPGPDGSFIFDAFADGSYTIILRATNPAEVISYASGLIIGIGIPTVTPFAQEGMRNSMVIRGQLGGWFRAPAYVATGEYGSTTGGGFLIPNFSITQST